MSSWTNFLKKKLNKPNFLIIKTPQRRGVVLSVRISTPRKPNSARRPVAKVALNTKKNILAHIPGQGHNLKRYAATLIRGQGARDLPGVRFTCIRGVYDLSGCITKKKRRSIYGVKKSDTLKKKLRRKFRVATK